MLCCELDQLNSHFLGVDRRFLSTLRLLNALAFSHYGCLVQDPLAWRRRSEDDLEENHRSVKQEASDNEALYSSLASVTSVPSHRLSLQWIIHKELHCFIAGRCEGDIILLCQVTMIFTARDCIALCCIVLSQQASIKIYSVRTQTPFYAVVCAPCSPLHLHLYFLITCLRRFITIA